MALLIDYDTAVQHLRLAATDITADPVVEEDVRLKTAQAEAIVMTHLKTHLWEVPPTWTDQTDPESDRQFALVQAAILTVLSHLWRFRGDDNQNTTDGPLSPQVVQMLSPLRDPSFA